MKRGLVKKKDKFYKFFVLLFLTGLIFCGGCQKKERDESEPIEEGSFQQRLFEEVRKKRRYKKEDEKVVSFRENPFLTWEEEINLSKTKRRKVLDYLTLSAIFYSSKNSFAVIDGHILKEGDTIDEKRIVRIEPKKVILKDEEGEYVVFLKNEE